jgi:hypothetical protein
MSPLGNVAPPETGDPSVPIRVKVEPQGDGDNFEYGINPLIKIEQYREVKQEGYAGRSDHDDDDLEYEENPLIKIEQDGSLIFLQIHVIVYF